MYKWDNLHRLTRLTWRPLAYIEMDDPPWRTIFWRIVFWLVVVIEHNITYPPVICYVAIENGPVEIVDLPMKHADGTHSYVTVYQRVT